MPKVPQLDWGKLKPIQPVISQPQGTNNFPTYAYKEPKKGSKHGAIKTTRRPKWNPIDKSIGKNWYDSEQHIRSIMQE